jgi:hypothetical protein
LGKIRPRGRVSYFGAVQVGINYSKASMHTIVWIDSA